MAEATKFAISNELSQDELVGHVRPDPQQEGAVRLAGFLGRSTNEGRWRVYLSLDLDHYLEVSEDDILHSLSLRGPMATLGGTLLWVRPDARLYWQPPQVRPAEERREEESFLEGEIVARHLPKMNMDDVRGNTVRPVASDVVPSGLVCIGVTILFEC